MTKKNMIRNSVLGFLVLGLLTPALVSAHGMFGFGGGGTPEERVSALSKRFTTEAQILGITMDEVKNYWAQGKGIREIAEEKGISEDALRIKMIELRKGEIKEHLTALVTQGVITQAQADQRFATMEKSISEGKGKFGKGGHRGRGMGF